MNEGSFSFLSYESQKYPNQVPQEFEPSDSKYSFKDSVIQHLPGTKGSMAGKVEIVLLLQAA